jgi:hypothetical protein
MLLHFNPLAVVWRVLMNLALDIVFGKAEPIDYTSTTSTTSTTTT